MSMPPAARPILERMACVCYLGVLAGSIASIWLGGITGNATAIGCAIAGLLCSRWLHVHGHAHWHFRERLAAFDSAETGEDWPRPEREEKLSGEITDLFNRMDVEGDVWARGQLRRELAARLTAAPSLREEFAEKLIEHPEL